MFDKVTLSDAEAELQWAA